MSSARRSSIVIIALGLISVAVTAAPFITRTAPVPQSAQHVTSAGALTGHPVEGAPPLAAAGQAQGMPLGGGEEPGCEEIDPALQVPALTPPLSGSFINFESPQTRPLALTADGRGLFATNTPNNSVVIMTTEGGLNIAGEVAVGLEPVAVAVQPGGDPLLVWVLNMVSDNISIVDVVARKVVDVIEVGDEPVDIVFSPDGAHAFVTLQGRADPASFDSANPQEGFVVVIDATTRQVVSSTFLDLHTPRSLAFDDVRSELLVAALHSGNNTTVVGRAAVLELNAPMPPDPNACEQNCSCDCVVRHALEIVRDFSVTAAAFAADGGLAPYPDPHEQGDAFPLPAPLVQRIIPDDGGGWHSIVDLLSDNSGNPDPAMVALMNTEFNMTNAADVIGVIINDAKPTADRDVVVLDVSNPADPAGLPIVEIVDEVGTTLTAMARNPVNGQVFVSNLEPRNLVRLEPNLEGHIVDHEIIILPPGPQRAPLQAVDLHAGLAAFNFGGPIEIPPDALEEARNKSLANPLSIEFSSDGAVAYLVALGPGRVAALDGTTAEVISRVDVGRGPRGAVLAEMDQLLYVINRTDMTVSAVDVATPTELEVVQTIALFNPEPPEVKDGRDFLYSTTFSANNAASCALCHIDGHLDHLAWDLGNPAGPVESGPPNLQNMDNHPLKGPMVTLSLKGTAGHGPFHWRGDRPTIQDFNPAFDGLLGGAELSAEDIDAFTAFTETLAYPPNPYFNRDGSFLEGSLAIQGACHFIERCGGCHQVAHDGAFDSPGGVGDGGNNLSGPPLFAQKQLVTQLRGIHKKFHSDRLTGFGLIHDGREEREDTNHPLMEFLLEFFPGFTADDRNEVISFVTAFQSNVMAVVGWQVTATGTDSVAERAQLLSAVAIMVNQHAMDNVAPSQADVTIKVFGDAGVTGHVLVAADPAIIFESDTHEAATLDALLDGVTGATVAVITAVPPGSGRRIGIDQDLDCLGDGLDLTPQQSNIGDSDFNGVVDTDDYGAFVQCLALDGPIEGTCRLYDSDCTGAYDNIDLAAFAELFGVSQDCNDNLQHDVIDVLSGFSVDANLDAVPDECQAPCAAFGDCADADGNGIRDDNCTWWACVSGICEATAIVFADMGGQFGVCPPDGAADGNDRNHALNCFANRAPDDASVAYGCEPDPPAALNVDAGGSFGACAADGVCDGNDAFHALTAFAAESACSCPTAGPAPEVGPSTVVDRVAVRLVPSARRVRPGAVVHVDVFIENAVSDLRGYQLHLAASGGRGGQLTLVDIAIRGDTVFTGHGPWQAFNTAISQMVAGLDGPGVATPWRGYLATFSYRVAPDASGTFVVELLHDDNAPTERTFFFASNMRDRIVIKQAQPAVIRIVPLRE